MQKTCRKEIPQLEMLFIVASLSHVTIQEGTEKGGNLDMEKSRLIWAS